MTSGRVTTTGLIVTEVPGFRPAICCAMLFDDDAVVLLIGRDALINDNRERG